MAFVDVAPLLLTATSMCYLLAGAIVTPVGELFKILARLSLFALSLMTPLFFMNESAVAVLALVVALLFIGGECVNYWKPFERARIKTEIAKRLPQASSRQAKAVAHLMLKAHWSVSAFTWHKGAIVLGRGPHSQRCDASGKWAKTPSGADNHYEPEHDRLNQERPALVQHLDKTDADNLCALMYFGWSINTVKELADGKQGAHVEIELSRHAKVMVKMFDKATHDFAIN